MKPRLLLYTMQCVIAVFLLTASFNLYAQDINNNPGAYMTSITNIEMGMDKSYLAYMSAVAHSGRARKVEKMRQRTLESIQDTRLKIANLPYFKGDNSLRQSNMDYVDMCYKVFGDDYAHIVNLENLIEQSFDEMQFYILLEEKTNEKLDDAVKSVDSAEKAFAQKNKVTIVDGNDAISNELETTSKVLNYQNSVYLLFYKCNWQEGQITKSINEKKVTGLEEARNALDTYAKEGLLALDSLNNFQGDPTLALACKWALQFYQKLAENELPQITGFFLKEDNFNKIKNAFQAKPRRSLTKQDVDTYNQDINDFNNSVNNYNQLNSDINNQNNQCIKDWENADQKFLDEHIPHVRS